MFKQLIASLILLSFINFVIIADDFIAGKQYEILKIPTITNNKNRIEVTEVFWYGCGHCYKFEPMLQAWRNQQPKHIKIIIQPAVWNSNMKLHAKAFYTAKVLGVLNIMHKKIFTAMNIQKNNLNSEKDIKKLFVVNGINQDKFDKTFNSFSIDHQIKIDSANTTNYEIQGTPEIIVNGKYRVSSSLTGSQAKMLEVVNFLINKEHKKINNLNY